MSEGNSIGIGFPEVWIAGWLFTIGFLKLTGWEIVKALFVWAYYLGVHFA